MGEPLPNEEKQPAIDFAKDEAFEFVFDIALAPEFDVVLDTNDEIDYYTIDVNGIQIFADTLFRSFSIFEDQEKVWLSVEKRNCLAVADKAAKRTGYHTAAEEKKSA